MKNIKPSELNIQSLLMSWAMNEANHIVAIPNVESLISWEVDLITINRAGFSTEFEIKISRGDYAKDAKKLSKISRLQSCLAFIRENKKYEAGQWIPNYFYYVTYDFIIDPPEWAGWMLVTEKEYRSYYILDVITKKKAPKLHCEKMGERQYSQMAKLLAYRLRSAYYKTHPFIQNKETPSVPPFMGAATNTNQPVGE